ncbi:hypothetical protein B0H10DRAFT_1949531 [Mycena sp. CBHHK59/15]|nr:hypothetical protein B0H10DRAFT_1949531 [Mycena sp. CBHHK59/15]
MLSSATDMLGSAARCLDLTCFHTRYLGLAPQVGNPVLLLLDADWKIIIEKLTNAVKHSAKLDTICVTFDLDTMEGFRQCRKCNHNSAAVFWLPPAPSLGITGQDLRDSMLSYSKVGTFLFQVLANELQAGRQAPAFARYSKAADIMSAFKTQFEAYTRQYPPFSRRSNTWSKAMHYWKSLEEHAEASIIAGGADLISTPDSKAVLWVYHRTSKIAQSSKSFCDLVSMYDEAKRINSSCARPSPSIIDNSPLPELPKDPSPVNPVPVISAASGGAAPFPVDKNLYDVGLNNPCLNSQPECQGAPERWVTSGGGNTEITIFEQQELVKLSVEASIIVVIVVAEAEGAITLCHNNFTAIMCLHIKDLARFSARLEEAQSQVMTNLPQHVPATVR